LDAQFIAGTRGELFTLYFPPAAAARDRGDLIFVPPFAEEMNRARATVAAQARAFAAAGTGVLMLDLYGTGDSEGTFADARWETWREDVRVAAAWLRARGRRRVGLWGLRLGGLLAMDALFDAPDDFERVLLWEPVLSGKAFMDQFLRIGIAEGMESGGRRVTLDQMRLKLSRTEPVEVAGYVISRILTHAIDRCDWPRLADALRAPLVWIDSAPLAPGRRATIDETARACAAAGVAMRYLEARGQPFWAVQDAAVDRSLIEATLGAAADADAAV
jgi:exosortase A-associated hydrolase 2